MSNPQTMGQLASAASTEVMIEIEGMNKWFDDFHVPKNIDLTVHKGERFVVCGPSDSGKSTLIRCINALEEHQEGVSLLMGSHWRRTRKPRSHPHRSRHGVSEL